MEKIHWRQNIKRLWISSVTDRAIRDGFHNLKPGKQFEDLYESAVCRAEAEEHFERAELYAAKCRICCEAH
ncbi:MULTISPECIES: hypothetical protein [Cytobacillus]|uniref:hypothetical protein n=1 Tax=Cytobacillus TaxID=2675230 RepID=UPI00203FD8B5|nr:hypothetical protein [Cytobacillus firmus]